jgi:hypothetical protein
MEFLKLKTIKDDYMDFINRELIKIGCSHSQVYFPILSMFPNNDNISVDKLSLNFCKVALNKQVSNEEDQDEYVKTIYHCDIIDNNNKKETLPVFIKIIPILEPVQYISGDYDNNGHGGKYNEYGISTINNYNNTAYTEVFANYLTSKLAEKNVCPLFPRFFGTFSSVINNFKYDSTDEWDDIICDAHFINKVDNGEIVYQFKKTEITEDMFEDISEELDIEEVNMDSNVEDTDEDTNDGDSNVEDSNVEDTDEDSNDEDSNDEDSNDEDSEIDDYYYIKWLGIKDYPVQLCLLEQIDETFDELIENDKLNTEEEWLSILFQIIFGLTILQKEFKMVHNDLHCDNIMFSKTEEKYLYYKINSDYYKIPTFGRITKIIDFARATYKLGNVIFFPNVFEEDGDAEGQYTKLDGRPDWEEGDLQPNPSFDLCYLATTIYEYLPSDSLIYKMLIDWTISDNGKPLLFDNSDFDLYVKLAKDCHNAVPNKQLNKLIFAEFKIKKEQIPENEMIYSVDI